MHRLISYSIQARSVVPSISILHVARGNTFSNDIHGLAHCACRNVRPEIEGFVFFYLSDNGQSGKVFFDGEPEIGILFVIPQDNIEPGTVAFDHIAFQQQGF